VLAALPSSQRDNLYYFKNNKNPETITVFGVLLLLKNLSWCKLLKDTLQPTKDMPPLPIKKPTFNRTIDVLR
jgi:hypothetical protein